MFSNADIKEMLDRGKTDGAKLYVAAEKIHTLTMIFISVFAVMGVIGGLAAMSDNGAGGILILVASGLICFVLYFSSILFTHTAKVLVNISFAALATASQGQK